MHRFLSLVLIFLISCSEPAPETPTSNLDKTSVSEPKRDLEPYVATHDLAGIRKHKVLRLIAPRFDGADALPRDGTSVLDYQSLAETFAQSLSLDVEWVFVDGFSDLIPSLNRGLGDLIVTNLTVTESREEQVVFSRAVTQVSELVIAAKSTALNSEKDLAGVNVTVPDSTSYLETLLKKNISSINVVESSLSDVDLLAGIVDGEYQATVLDSDITRSIIDEFPSLEVKFEINKHRPIAWAVRKDNPVLLRKLNEFLVSHHVRQASNSYALHDWDAIKQSGRLRMLTLNNPASYFMWRGELMGFDYDLMKKFAEQHKLHVAVVIKESIPELFDALKKGEGDVVAASITYAQDREVGGVAFTKPYLFVDELIVGRAEAKPFKSISDLSDASIGVNPDTVFTSRLQALGEWKLVKRPGATTESLIAAMADGEFDYTVADSHLLSLEQSYHQNVKSVFTLSEDSPIVWGLRTDQKQLQKNLNAFIKKQYRGLFYNVTFKKYFENDRKIKSYQEGRVLGDGRLSPYDDLVKKHAKKINMDWRLLVSQMYQESKFNPKAKSFAGARGLMQVMPRTGKELGYANLYEPETGIAAGVAYLDWLEDRFPGELDFQERIFFALASYNAGAGHVRDARKLAKQLGYNPDKWFGNVELAMLKLAEPKYYKKARFGYVRGTEPVTYVRKIHERYLAYLSATK